MGAKNRQLGMSMPIGSWSRIRSNMRCGCWPRAVATSQVARPIWTARDRGSRVRMALFYREFRRLAGVLVDEGGEVACGAGVGEYLAVVDPGEHMMFSAGSRRGVLVVQLCVHRVDGRGHAGGEHQQRHRD